MATDVTSNRNMIQTMISERKKTMISKMQFMNSVLGKPVVDAVVQTLYNQSNDFPAIYEAYLAAVEKMHAVLGPDAKHEIQKYVTPGQLFLDTCHQYLKLNIQNKIHHLSKNVFSTVGPIFQ